MKATASNIRRAVLGQFAEYQGQIRAIFQEAKALKVASLKTLTSARVTLEKREQHDAKFADRDQDELGNTLEAIEEIRALGYEDLLPDSRKILTEMLSRS